MSTNNRFLGNNNLNNLASESTLEDIDNFLRSGSLSVNENNSSNIDTKLGTIDIDTGNIATSTTSIDTKITATNQALNTSNINLGNIHSKLGTIDTDTGNISTYTNNIDIKLGTIDTDTGNISTNTNNIDSKLGTTNTTLSTISTNTTNLNNLSKNAGNVDANTLRMVLANASSMNVINENDFISNMNTKFNNWYLMSNDNLDQKDHWDFTSNFTATSVRREKGLQISNSSSSSSATIKSNYIFPRIPGASQIYLYRYTPWNNGNWMGDNIILKFGLLKVLNNTYDSYSRIVVNSSGSISIEYKNTNNSFSIASSNFNIDILDGNGLSGYDFNEREAHCFYILESAIESSRTYYGVFRNGRFYNFHYVDFHGTSWTNPHHFKNRWVINVDGEFSLNSGLVLLGVSSFCSVDLSFSKISQIGHSRNYAFTETSVATETKCIASIRYFNASIEDQKSIYLSKITLCSTLGGGLVELIIYKIQDTITVSGGSNVNISGLEMRSNPTVSGTVNDNQRIYSDWFRNNDTFDLSSISHKHIGYNVSDGRILLLFYIRNIETSSTDIYPCLNWVEL